MTKKRLEAYRSEKQEIKELEYKLKMLNTQNYTGVDTILDYRSGYPVPQAVTGTNIDTYRARKEHLQSKIDHLLQRCLEVEEWIENIQDSTIRRIFRMYYEDGQRQQEIARHLHVDRSLVSKKINNYIKND